VRVLPIGDVEDDAGIRVAMLDADEEVGAARVEHATRPLGVKIVQCPDTYATVGVHQVDPIPQVGLKASLGNVVDALPSYGAYPSLRERVALGARTGVFTTRRLSVRKTSSNVPEKLASRSRSRMCPSSSSCVIDRFRIC
jgi:hypothetical protein